MNEKPVIVAREGRLAGQRWTIDTDEFIVGRGSDCQIYYLSGRFHAITSKLFTKMGVMFCMIWVVKTEPI